MHNESNADVPQDIATPSKLKKFVRLAPVAALYTGGVVVIGASTYMGLRTQAINLKVAQLALEAAQNTAA
jgi:hypothetical protein